mmetsp:Transcript_70574/g.181969  ORF Transcript_70574/g.181969 Transcript_70574/m.181969 type:complete len:295 (+) Transcript_70574:51-935(+)
MGSADRSRARRQRLSLCMPFAACATAAAVMDTAFIGAKVGQPQAPSRVLHVAADGKAPEAAAPLRSAAQLFGLAPAILAASACVSQLRRRSEAPRRSRHVRYFFGGKKDGEAEAEEEGEEELTEVDMEAIAKVQQEVDELVELKEEKLQAKDRLTLEISNFRTRTKNELAAARGKAAVPIVKELLMIADEFEYAKQNLKIESEGEQAVADRFDNLFNGMLDTWKKVGVEKMQATGEDFNPELHEAVSMIPSEEYAADKVCNTLRGGWVLKTVGNDTPEVLRPALVCVSAGPGPS